MNSPVERLVNFKLARHELVSGEPIFYVPVNAAGEVVGVSESVSLKGFVFNCGETPEGCLVPCGCDAWDQYAVCLSTGRMGLAVAALDCTAAQLATSNIGWFTRYEASDLVWEVTVEDHTTRVPNG